MKKAVIISILLLAAIAVSFVLPKPKYAGVNILNQLKVPAEFTGWTSRDMSKELNLQDDRYNFISDVFARLYKNSKGDEILLLILDAGNFHNPKVCYASSGFTIKELGAPELKADRPFKANALYMEKDKYGMVMFYWLCIDKKVVDWAEQKMIELWSSLSNKKKAGLMVRIEIPVAGKSPQECLQLAGDFVQTLNNSLSAEQKEYLFGE